MSPTFILHKSYTGCDVINVYEAENHVKTPLHLFAVLFRLSFTLVFGD